MAEDLLVGKDVIVPGRELRWQFSRSSGPGGQSVNTSDSRVSLSFDLARTEALAPYLRQRALRRLQGRLVDGVVTVHAEAQRSQYLNRIAARQRLADLLAGAIAVPPPKRRPTKPSRGARERRISSKKRRGQTKALRRPVQD